MVKKSKLWLIFLILILFLVLSFRHNDWAIYLALVSVFLTGFYFIIKKRYMSHFIGIFILISAILLFFITNLKENLNLGLIWLLCVFILIILYSLVVFKDRPFLRGGISAYFFLFGLLTTQNSSRTFTTALFNLNFSFSTIFLSISFILFTLLAGYLFIKSICEGLSNKIQIPFFDRINNCYFILGIILISVILLIGFSNIRDTYLNNNQVNFDFKDSNETIIGKGICASDKEYTIEDRKLDCNIILYVKNFTVDESNIKMYIRGSNEFWAGDYNNSYYNAEKIQNTDEIIFNFVPKKEIIDYWIQIYYLSLNESHYAQSDKFSLNTITNEEYETKMRNRLLAIVGIISIALFSVFSAMNNIREILENQIQKDSP